MISCLSMLLSIYHLLLIHPIPRLPYAGTRVNIPRHSCSHETLSTEMLKGRRHVELFPVVSPFLSLFNLYSLKEGKG